MISAVSAFEACPDVFMGSWPSWDVGIGIADMFVLSLSIPGLRQMSIQRNHMIMTARAKSSQPISISIP